ncbi:hypothetical protein [Rhodoferax sp. UBA5149]|uniref:hypothetical protein n=1 Tax=Rhodoferax sp. UBA5149 TaxID=1947379 RepID=UPI0025E2DE38|nr:hypothetical protein [Rhodoferax sp. UBA5149]
MAATIAVDLFKQTQQAINETARCPDHGSLTLRAAVFSDTHVACHFCTERAKFHI